MARFRHTITVGINLPPEAVFKSVVDGLFDTWVPQIPGIIEAEKTSPGPMGVGTTGRYLSEDARRIRTENTCEVTEYSPPSRFAYRTLTRFADEQPRTQRPLSRNTTTRSTWEMTLTPVAGRTRATLEAIS